MTIKICIGCKEEKTIDQFTTDTGHKDHHYPYCKKCASEKQRKYYKDHPDRVKATVKKWVDNNQNKTKAHNAVHMAMRSGKIIKPERCEACGEIKEDICAHHINGYSKEHWLDINWVCHNCHSSLHNQ